MATVDPLLIAAAAYTAETWTQDDWRRFGRETGTSDILTSHPRLYRSQSFGDDDYPDAAEEVLRQVLREGPASGTGEAGRMDLLADSIPDLPTWIAANGASRTKRLFSEYIAARAFTEIPEQWISSHYVSEAQPAAEDPRAAGEGTPQAAPDSAPVATIPCESPIMSASDSSGTSSPSPLAPRGGVRPKIFIVHGHDEAAMNSIRIYVHELTDVVPTSLAEKPGGGNTIIEKFEHFGAEASYVIVLLTADDVGQTAGSHKVGDDPAPRARQNVVLELGYFIGKVGRRNIVVIDAGVERPSDLAGLSYVQYPGTNWKDELRKELAHAGLLQ